MAPLTCLISIASIGTRIFIGTSMGIDRQGSQREWGGSAVHHMREGTGSRRTGIPAWNPDCHVTSGTCEAPSRWRARGIESVWWALLDSNQRPRDSGWHGFPRSPDYLITFGLAVKVSGALGGH